MKKEIVKKYWNEVTHWKDGGKIAIYRTNTEELSEPTDNIGWVDDDNVVYLIADEYLEFRLALVQGKIVQHNFSKSGKEFPNIWKDMETLKFYGKPDEYRIKPEEPKFEIGNWVRVNGVAGEFIGKINAIGCNGELTINSRSILKETKITLWYPQPEEWCVFYNENSKTFKVGKFKCVNAIGLYVPDVYSYDYCEPYIGQKFEDLTFEKLPCK